MVDASGCVPSAPTGAWQACALDTPDLRTNPPGGLRDEVVAGGAAAPSGQRHYQAVFSQRIAPLVRPVCFRLGKNTAKKRQIT